MEETVQLRDSISVDAANLWWLMVQVPGLLLLYYGMSWVYRAIPERVSIFDDCLLIQQGESAIQIDKPDLIAGLLTILNVVHWNIRSE